MRTATSPETAGGRSPSSNRRRTFSERPSMRETHRAVADASQLRPCAPDRCGSSVLQQRRSFRECGPRRCELDGPQSPIPPNPQDYPDTGKPNEPNLTRAGRIDEHRRLKVRCLVFRSLPGRVLINADRRSAQLGCAVTTTHRYTANHAMTDLKARQ